MGIIKNIIGDIRTYSLPIVDLRQNKLYTK